MVTPDQMLAANARSRPLPEPLDVEQGFCLRLSYGTAEIEQIDEDKVRLEWVAVPAEIEGHGVDTRLVTEAAMECLRRGARLLIASPTDPAALKIDAKVFGAENLSFFEADIPSSDNVDPDVMGWTPVPITFDQAMWASRNLELAAQKLRDAGKEYEAQTLDSFVRLAVDLTDSNVLAAIQNAERIYLPEQ